MFKNYFKTAWRSLWKNKAFTLINMAGLAIGMAACIVILLFVFYERGFDGMHTKNIYRLDEVQKFEGMVAPQNVALSMFPMGPTLKAEFPEIRNFTRVRSNSKVDLTYKEKKIFFPAILYVDSTFLQLFDFRLLKGDRSLVLQKPNSVVLTEESAAKLFGKEEAIGKTVMRYIGDTIPFTVTGIMENVPKNSHLQFDGLFSFSTMFRPQLMENWGGNWLVTYLELAPHTNIAALEKKFPAYLKRHMQDENWKYYELFLQSLKEVHDHSASITHDYLNFQKFDSSYTDVFLVIALIILVIACINFMNLSTARSAERAKEVGIRKTIGALRLQLAMQFIGESVLIALLALGIALVLSALFLPAVNNISQRELRLPWNNIALMLIILIATVLVGVLAGLYPAGYLSSFQPVKVLKGSVQTGRNKSRLRNILVIGQFTGAVFLMIATVFAVKQLKFMQTKDAGFNRDQVMILPLDRATSDKYGALKTELLKSSLIKVVTASQQRLGNNLHQTGVVFHGDGPARELTSSQVVVDDDYLTLYKIPMVAGRNFSKDYSTDNAKAYIVNETMAKELLKDHPRASYETLIGKHYGFGGMDSAGVIVGVAKDFNFNSLHYKIETLSILCQKDWGFAEVSVRINGAQTKEAIAYIQQVWKQLNADHPFDYTFLDEHFEELYRSDREVSKIVGILASLAIIISCLGLFGLASYSAERRVKEIGIRKVLGASVQGIVSLLSRDFIKLVIVANIIAWPLAWFVVNRWLRDFAYRIDINWWVFIIAGVAAVLIAQLTVAFQAIRAAVSNPVKSLRSE